MSESSRPRSEREDDATPQAGGKRAEKRRRDVRAIVDAVRRLAEEGGVEAVRLREVATAAGVSMGALYRCFESKEDILLYAFAEDFTALERHVASRPPAGETPLERVVAFFRTATRGIVAHPRYGRAVLAATASGQQAAVRQMATLHARMSHLIYTTMVGPDHEGRVVEDEALELASQVLNRVWFAALVAWAGGLQSIDDVIDDIRRTAALLLAGAAALG
jgi:AcrR family transcriptional regulator